MKTRIANIILSATLIFLLNSCGNKNENTDPNGISGSIINHSECKGLNSGGLKSEYPDTVSCVHYNYDTANKTLTMKHINAGFNCCPEQIYCEISENNDTIIISEFEKEQSCNCNCLFDLDILLNGVEENIYFVRFIEPYVGGQEELIFQMDLTIGNENEYCVIRKGYPWGE
jgi:hypothetical protein